MIEVYLEVGARKSFASTRAWPGWVRWARTPEAALAALADYRPRYEVIARRAGFELPSAGFEVVTRIEGNATTDFGAPGAIPDFDRDRLRIADTERRLAVFEAAWDLFHEVASRAPEELRKGPRGGGRNTSKVVEHVDGAERSYLRQIGVRAGSRPAPELRESAMTRLVEIARHPEETKWPPAYYIRRSVWHVVDHLWEIEDRS